MSKTCLSVVLCLAACTSEPSATGNSSSAGGSSGSSSTGGALVPIGALVPACPAQVPSDGGACPEPGKLDCEYGNDWDALCNPIAECWRGGPLNATWQLLGPDTGASSPCPTPATLSPGCPASAPPAGSSCPPAAAGALCPYAPELCGCIELSDSPAPDGGSWVCSSAGPGCPAMRPRIGSACTPAQEGAFCEYAVCGIGAATSCSGGVWLDGVLISHCE